MPEAGTFAVVNYDLVVKNREANQEPRATEGVREANIFGERMAVSPLFYRNMSEVTGLVEETAAPSDRPRVTIDVRELPPPKPLQNTLERLAEVDDETVVIQVNDRAPQHIYPKLSDRGYEYETVETDTLVVTALWRE